MRKQILENYPEQVFMFADGFDDAIIGVDAQSMRIIYSVERIINILEKDMRRELAIEFFDFNIDGAYMGKQTPIYCKDIF